MRYDHLIEKLREPGHKETGKRFLSKVANYSSRVFAIESTYTSHKYEEVVTIDGCFEYLLTECLTSSRKEGFGQRATLKYLTSVPVLKDVTSRVDFGRKDSVYFLQILSIEIPSAERDSFILLEEEYRELEHDEISLVNMMKITRTMGTMVLFFLQLLQDGFIPEYATRGQRRVQRELS
ncbi:hypothetical protein L1987_85559 [Smallanthus sonchifolius]|uniref:Uncharacterized protein n=1 Tax=Smallanthus sonchifolius TaxID=185202 RepID=A0ACB8XXK9_9ASTR|nr:hypothetical protein L1987_85559 [Smallanthus sonchifolius]